MKHVLLLVVMVSVCVLFGCKSANPSAAAAPAEGQPYVPLSSMDNSTTGDAYNSDYAVGDSNYAPPPADTAEPPADEPLAPAGARTYVVKRGDTLYSIARRFYNDGTRWRDILEANRSRMRDERHIAVGTELVIP